MTPIADPAVFLNAYGPYAFGVVAFLIILTAIVAAVVRPVLKMRDEDRKERAVDLVKIEEISKANAALTGNLCSLTESLSKMNEDQKVIAKLQDVSMQRGERMLAVLERLTQKDGK